MYAIPTSGRRVPIPGTRLLLPTRGQNIGPLTQYWLRRLRDGDISVHPTAPVSDAKSVASSTAETFTRQVLTTAPAPLNVSTPTFPPVSSIDSSPGGATS